MVGILITISCIIIITNSESFFLSLFGDCLGWIADKYTFQNRTESHIISQHCCRCGEESGTTATNNPSREIEGNYFVLQPQRSRRKAEHKTAIIFVGHTNNAIMISRDVPYKQ